MTSFRDTCAHVDQAIEDVKVATAKTKKILVDRRFEPGPADSGPRPEYLLHLDKTRGPNDLVEVEVPDD